LNIGARGDANGLAIFDANFLKLGVRLKLEPELLVVEFAGALIELAEVVDDFEAVDRFDLIDDCERVEPVRFDRARDFGAVFSGAAIAFWYDWRIRGDPYSSLILLSTSRFIISAFLPYCGSCSLSHIFLSSTTFCLE
jgi:hypothetical protein